MAEETASGASQAADPAAIALALAGASRAEADAYLRDQRYHLHEQLKQIHLDIWEKVLGVLLRLATAFVGLAVAAGCGFLIWNAAQSNELVVDSFSVPPDLAQKGISGDVLAGQVVDRLVTMQAQTTSFRAPQSYASGFNASVKLEIPETGISLMELDRFLREKLGSDTHISGALFRTAAGVRLTARAGALASDSFEGKDEELDALIQRAAEAIYQRTQPFRYATYVWNRGRDREAHQLFEQLAKTGLPSDRAWALVSVGSTTLAANGSSASDDAINANIRFAKRAIEIDPSIALSWSALGSYEELLGRNENALFDYRKALAAVSSKEHGQIRLTAVSAFQENMRSRISAMLGDYAAAGAGEFRFSQSGNTSMNPGISATAALYHAAGHDTRAARATLGDPLSDPIARLELGGRYRGWARIFIAYQEQDWSRVVQEAEASRSESPTAKIQPFLSGTRYVAVAEARLGHFAKAEALIAGTPVDCYPCLIARAKIAEMQDQHARADAWFAQAAAAGPSLPLAHTEWGHVLLERGDANGAIAKFALARQRGPRFADPLVYWGEALMAKNQSHLAPAKFRQAETLAPNWGRLYLKWGETLIYAGKKAEAQKHFARAAQLDLTPSEKAELAGQSATLH